MAVQRVITTGHSSVNIKAWVVVLLKNLRRLFVVALTKGRVCSSCNGWLMSTGVVIVLLLCITKLLGGHNRARFEVHNTNYIDVSPVGATSAQSETILDLLDRIKRCLF